MLLLTLPNIGLAQQDTTKISEVDQAVTDSLSTKGSIDSTQIAAQDSAVTKTFLLEEEDQTPFSHRFKYINSAYQHVDTTVQVDQFDGFIVPNGDAFGLLPMSNFGHVTQRLFFKSDTSHLSDFYFGEGERTFKNIKDLPYYDVKSPISDMRFITGYNRGQDFRMHFSQNLGSRWNYYGSYNRTNSLGDYSSNLVLRDDFQLTSHYTNPNRRFQVLGAFQFNRIKLTENGGITNLAEFTENQVPNRESVLINLPSASRNVTRSDMYRVNAFSRQQYSLFVNKRDFRVTAFHDVEFQNKSFAFNTSNTTFFPAFTLGPITADTLRSNQWTQKAGVSLGKTDASGRRQELRAFAFYHFQNLGSELFNSYQEAIGLGYEANFQNESDLLYFTSTGALNTIGNLAGSMLSGQLRLGKATSWHAKGDLVISGKTPNLFWQNYRSNFYNWLNTDLDPIRTQKIGFSGNFGKVFHLGYTLTNLQNWMYLDTLSLPFQATNDAQIQEVAICTSTNLGKWTVENQLRFQAVTGMGDYAYIRLPELLYRGKLFYNYSILKGVLFGQLGLDVTYFSKYQALTYNPALAQFHLQDGDEIGDFIYAHFFASAQLKSFQFFVRIENLTGGVFAYDYFAAPAYPLPDRFVRVGFNWRFFN